MLPSAAELEYFIEISITLNLSHAAKSLGISQPSLSLALKRLENTVGTTLFIRHKNGVTLTQAGKQFLIYAKELKQRWEEAKAHALASHNTVQGHFTLGCHPTVAAYLVSNFLPGLLEKYPKLEIQLILDISRKIVEQVIHLSVDVGIVANPNKHPDLIIHKLCDDTTCFWRGAGSKNIQNIHVKDSIILCNLELSQTQFLLKKCKNAGILSERIMNIDSLEVIASLAANGCGIGILPTRVVNSLYPDKLTKIQKAPTYSDEIYLIYRRENKNIHGIQAILKAIKEPKILF